MTITLALTVAGLVVGLSAAAFALWTWWRLMRRLDTEVWDLRWDLDALTTRLERYVNEATEHPDN